jgi:hypothetical protein
MSTILKKQYKSPNPALNVRPCDEPVATDTIYSDTLAIDCGFTSAQLFVGTKTHTADVYPIKSNKQFVNTLLDNITQRGAPTKLISDLTLTHFHLAKQAASTASEPCQTPVPEHQMTVQHHPRPLWGSGVHLASLSHVCVLLAQQHMV